MDKRKLATIQKIAEIQPIEGADAIEKVRVNEWWCVAKKGEFKVSDPCVYFEIDSLLPSSNPVFSFLAKGGKEKKMLIDGVMHSGHRLKTIRLRGQLSQGLALPIQTALPGEWPKDEWREGEDISDILGVVKYEPPMPAELAGKVKGNFPGFIPKTDEERIQNMAEVVARHVGKEFYVTEKIDGSSMTVYKKNGVLGVCSRNLELLETEGNTFWKLAREYGLGESIPEGIAVQGEIYGEGIQGNPLKLTGQHFAIYNVYDFEAGRYYDHDEFQAFCDARELPMVPLYDGHFVLDEFYTKAENLLAMADGASYLNESVRREGLVFRPLKEQKEQIRGSEQRFSFKAISNAYLLGE